MEKNILPADFYLQDTLSVAKQLIGKYLVRKINSQTIIARITETEAYIGAIDKASHAYGYKRTPRTNIMFETGGIAYVYLIYGMYYCLNVVAEKQDEPSAVLIRGVEIVKGHEEAARLRYGKDYHELTKQNVKDLSNGPGKLCKALSITKENNGCCFSGGDLLIQNTVEGIDNPALTIQISKRIGIDYAEEATHFPWRFFIKN